MPDHSPDAARTLAALMLDAAARGDREELEALRGLDPDELAGLLGAGGTAPEPAGPGMLPER